MTKIREMSPQVAGIFYPRDASLLRRTIDTYLREADNIRTDGNLKAVMLPHAGYEYSGSIAAKGYRLIRNLDQEKSWTVILIGVSHLKPFMGISVGDYDQYATPAGPVSVSPLVKELINQGASFIEEAHRDEHSLEVQMPFLKQSLKHFEIVPILTSNTDPAKLADLIEPVLDESTILVISSDLSHMLSYEKAQEVDNRTLKWIIDADEKNLKNHAEACGLTGILTMVILSKRLAWHRKFISYRNSGDIQGEKSKVVGYGCIACHM